MPDNRTIAPGGFNYTGLRDNTAETLIARFGKTATLRFLVESSGANPWDPPTETPIDYEVTVVETSIDTKDRDGTLIEETDRMFLVSTDGVTEDPELANRLLLGGRTFHVKALRPLKPGPVTMLYKLHAGS